MVDRYGPLNDRQLTVLRWISDGCPDGVMVGFSYKTTAVALQGRRLVAITRRRGGWQVALTDTGRYYLEHGRHPLRPLPAQRGEANPPQPGRPPQPHLQQQPDAREAALPADRVRASVPAGPGAGDAEGKPADDGNRASASGAAASVGPAVTAELVLSRIREAGGELVISDVDEEEFAAWRRAAKVAQLRLLRAGRQRLNRWTDGNTLRLRLDMVPATDAHDDELTDEDYEQLFRSWAPPPVVPRRAEFEGRRVPVPSKVTKPHPLLEQLTTAMERQDRMWQAQYGVRASLLVRRRPMVRMRRLWQALINEALFRGYSVRVEEDRRNSYLDTAWLVVEIGQDAFPVRLYGDTTTPLRLTLPDDTQRRRRNESWADADGTPIEKRLGAVFTRIEQRAELAIARRAEQQRQADQRRREWKAAMAEARQQYAEDHRRHVIAERISNVAYADDVRAYVKLLRARAAELPTSRAESVRAWADWAERHADDIDPRRSKAGMPVIPDPEPEQLEPYLENLSPYGPY